MSRGVKLELTGKVFGNLIVLRKDINRTKFGNVQWVCECICGSRRLYLAQNLLSGQSKSCGCTRSYLAKERFTKHDMSGSSEYKIWAGMKARCYNKSNASFQHYGGRGITVCDSWLNSFEAFFDDMGNRPTSNHSIDRINNNGNYEPGNCRWTTQFIQCINTRRRRKNSSGLRGVFWNKEAEKWVSQISVNKKRVYVGASESLFEIACLRFSAENKLWQSFRE